MGYEHYTVEQVLSKLLPQSLWKEGPSSFEVAGPIAHLNLREEYLPFRYLIGRVILDKVESIQICVNKIGTIQNEFCTFPMKIIADDHKVNGVQLTKRRRLGANTDCNGGRGGGGG